MTLAQPPQNNAITYSPGSSDIYKAVDERPCIGGVTATTLNKVLGVLAGTAGSLLRHFAPVCD